MITISSTKRLQALDGLRGFAIIMVFLSHLDLHTLEIPVLSPFINYLLVGNGGLGVASLFILSGFLMAYLYPQPSSSIEFIQKRYTRIFPLFLTISSSLLIMKLLPQNLFLQAFIMLSLAIVTHIVWVYLIKPMTADSKQKLFYAFFCLQIIVSGLYLWTSQNPALLHQLEKNKAMQTLTVGLVNATLTFPVGNYVSMLDAVYWSLAAEVFFYILYPLICAPVIAYLSGQKRVVKILFLISLLPFFLGVQRISERLFSFSIIRFDFFIFFVGGMTLGYLYRKLSYTSRLYRSLPFFLSTGSIVLFIGIISLVHVWYGRYFSGPVNLEVVAILFTFLVALLLVPKTALARIFSSKFLVYIGTVSYSIYLTHIWVQESIIRIFGKSDGVRHTVLLVLAAFAINVLLASILYWLLERPYFTAKPAKKVKKITFIYQPPARNAALACISVFSLYLATAFTVYKWNLKYDFLHDRMLDTIITYPVIIHKAPLRVEEEKTLIMLLPLMATFGFVATRHMLSLYRAKIASSKESPMT